FQHSRRMKLVLIREADQLVVRDAAPQEERKSRGQLRIADAVRLARLDVGRFLLAAHQELRTRQNPVQGQLDAVLECSASAALLIKAHRPFEICRSRSPPERPPRQRRQYLPRAGFLLSRAIRMASEDLADALGILGARWVERTLYAEEPDRRIILQLR